VFDKEIKDLIDYAAEYIEDTTDDWFRVKKQLVNLFPPKKRKLFTRRHYSTKKHVINDFEKEVMKYWCTKTGVELKIDENKMHDPNWVQKPKGWALMEINEERRKVREMEKSNKIDK